MSDKSDSSSMLQLALGWRNS